MTIAIAMKINDGIILATDSSSTILGKNENGDDEVHHTYYTADKIFNLKKRQSYWCYKLGRRKY